VADLGEIIDTLKIFQFHSQEDTRKRCFVTQTDSCQKGTEKENKN
jgi:hypothetical protein